jgi:hypothetical protein
VLMAVDCCGGTHDLPLVARQIGCRICPHHFPNITDSALAGSIFVRCVGAHISQT